MTKWIWLRFIPRVLIVCAGAFMMPVLLLGQEPEVAQSDELIHAESDTERAWHLGHPSTTGEEGVGVDVVLNTWPLIEPDQPVVVAVIDTGFDIEHPALAPVWWENIAEKEGDPGHDDDDNGFVDDIHGWNFLAASDGTPLLVARMEVTREWARLQNMDSEQFDQDEQSYYQRVEKSYTKQRESWLSRYAQAYMLEAMWNDAEPDLQERGTDPSDSEAMRSFEPTDGIGHAAQQVWHQVEAMTSTWGSLDGILSYAENAVEVWYNPNFSESAVLGDDPNQLDSKGYGHGKIVIEGAMGHGTAVAGALGGQPWEGATTRGVCPWVRIIGIRAIPDGDERDKDVATAIRYAIQAGAQVVCMSFGKEFSPHSDLVTAAMREAAEADIVLVHAAGNGSANVDEGFNYPTPVWIDGDGQPQRVATWLEVGASGPQQRRLAARFSNFGVTQVDLFAPGVDIVAPHPGGGESPSDGTSLAAPLVAGVAAVLRSQYPEASAEAVCAAILDGVRRYPDLKVRRPGGGRVVFAELSRSGGVVDLPGALRALAENYGDEDRWPKRSAGELVDSE